VSDHFEAVLVVEHCILLRLFKSPKAKRPEGFSQDKIGSVLLGEK
jgi:hypothetical protein